MCRKTQQCVSEGRIVEDCMLVDMDLNNASFIKNGFADVLLRKEMHSALVRHQGYTQCVLVGNSVVKLHMALIIVVHIADSVLPLYSQIYI